MELINIKLKHCVPFIVSRHIRCNNMSEHNKKNSKAFSFIYVNESAFFIQPDYPLF